MYDNDSEILADMLEHITDNMILQEKTDEQFKWKL